MHARDLVGWFEGKLWTGMLPWSLFCFAKSSRLSLFGVSSWLSLFVKEEGFSDVLFILHTVPTSIFLLI